MSLRQQGVEPHKLSNRKRHRSRGWGRPIQRRVDTVARVLVCVSPALNVARWLCGSLCALGPALAAGVVVKAWGHRGSREMVNVRGLGSRDLRRGWPEPAVAGTGPALGHSWVCGPEFPWRSSAGPAARIPGVLSCPCVATAAPAPEPSVSISAPLAPRLPRLCGDHGRVMGEKESRLGCEVRAWEERWSVGSPVSSFSQGDRFAP